METLFVISRLIHLFERSQESLSIIANKSESKHCKYFFSLWHFKLFSVLWIGKGLQPFREKTKSNYHDTPPCNKLPRVSMKEKKKLPKKEKLNTQRAQCIPPQQKLPPPPPPPLCQRVCFDWQLAREASSAVAFWLGHDRVSSSVTWKCACACLAPSNSRKKTVAFGPNLITWGERTKAKRCDRDDRRRRLGKGRASQRRSKIFDYVSWVLAWLRCGLWTFFIRKCIIFFLKLIRV